MIEIGSFVSRMGDDIQVVVGTNITKPEYECETSLISVMYVKGNDIFNKGDFEVNVLGRYHEVPKSKVGEVLWEDEEKKYCDQEGVLYLFRKILDRGCKEETHMGDTVCFYCGIDIGIDEHEPDCAYVEIEKIMKDKG